MKFDELVGELLVLLRVVRVQILGVGHLGLEQLLLVSETILVLLELELQALLLLVEDLLALKEHVIVEAKLLLVELVDSLHVFHALLENLHLSLELDFLLGLLVRIIAHDLLKIFRILGLFGLAILLVLGLDAFLLLELLFDFLFVAVKDRGALAIELSFDCCQLLVVVLAHVCELGLHRGDQRVNVNGHALDGLDVVAVLCSNLSFELVNEFLFVGNDLGAGSFLCFNVLF